MRSLTALTSTLTGLALAGAMALTLASCAGPNRSETDTITAPGPNEGLPYTIDLPTSQGSWVPEVSHRGRIPAEGATIDIERLGTFSFEASEVETTRPDIFRPGHFSVFDVLVHLSERGEIDLEYHFDEGMNTHVIDAINGEPHWWYEARYSQGWFETNVFRMDMYPFKDGTDIRVFTRDEDYMDRVYRTFAAEVERLGANNGEVVIPRVVINGPLTDLVFENVTVTPHDTRPDILAPGVVTALDILLSLGEQGSLESVGLTWYDRIAGADPVDGYWVERINADQASGGCGFVYETGPEEFRGFAGSHIHIPLDVRVIVSPEYALWFWICL
jgi:hypothetical protein